MMPALFTSTSAAERRLGGVEQTTDGLRVAHICLGGQRAPAGRFDLAHQRLGGRVVAGIVYDDCETVARQPLRHCGADAARGAGHNRYLAAFIGHFQSPQHRSFSPGGTLLLGRRFYAASLSMLMPPAPKAMT